MAFCRVRYIVMINEDAQTAKYTMCADLKVAKALAEDLAQEGHAKDADIIIAKSTHYVRRSVETIECEAFE